MHATAAACVQANFAHPSPFDQSAARLRPPRRSALPRAAAGGAGAATGPSALTSVQNTSTPSLRPSMFLRTKRRPSSSSAAASA